MIVVTKIGTNQSSSVKQIFFNGQPTRDGLRKIFEWMISTSPLGRLKLTCKQQPSIKEIMICTFSFPYCTFINKIFYIYHCSLRSCLLGFSGTIFFFFIFVLTFRIDFWSRASLSKTFDNFISYSDTFA